MDWRPIESAPKDGTSILLWAMTHIDGVGCQLVAWWNRTDENWTFHVDFEEVLFAHSPRYWMPLPAPPMIDAARTKESV